jgi:RNA polymerase sigma factor (sigma-70 family)
MDNVGPDFLTRLVHEHSAALVLYARQGCRAPEDVVQEAFLQLMRQAVAPSNVVAWLHRVVRNEAINASRSESRRLRHEVSRPDRSWFTPSMGESLDAAAAGEALQHLTIEERETIVLRIWSKLSFEEIAELTNTSKSTAHRRFETGLAAMRARMGVTCPKQEARE